MLCSILGWKWLFWELGEGIGGPFGNMTRREAVGASFVLLTGSSRFKLLRRKQKSHDLRPTVPSIPNPALESRCAALERYGLEWTASMKNATFSKSIYFKRFLSRLDVFWQTWPMNTSYTTSFYKTSVTKSKQNGTPQKISAEFQIGNWGQEKLLKC